MINAFFLYGYGYEIWAFENMDILKRLRLKFCKHILHLKQLSSNVIGYAELGRYPLEIKAKSQLVFFLGSLITGKDSNIFSLLCKSMFINYDHNGIDKKWLSIIKNI